MASLIIGHIIKMPGKKPWILVWDLDETIVTGWKRGWKPEDIYINPKAALIISTALKLRITGIVRYIFLLTNNSDELYINAAIKKLGEYINYKGKIFNERLINDPAVRTSIVSKTIGNPDKSLRDVDFLLRKVHSPNNHSEYRILFFDDRPDHVFKWQLPLEHYIQVATFSTANALFDSTPWERAMRLLKGRAFIMKTRKRRARSRFTRRSERQLKID
jgi:hypothetical protein